MRRRLTTVLFSCAYIILIGFTIPVFTEPSLEIPEHETYTNAPTHESISIKSVNGYFYAYIVLLYNENPHFVNIIQKDSIPLKMIGNEGFNVKEYRNYVNKITDRALKAQAQLLLNIFLEPKKYDSLQLRALEKALTERNIILKFSRDRNSGTERITLDYCIFGKKELITINHPLITIKEKMYIVHPYIYYDEFSTSNSTFYFDMIYINPDEVTNDYLIAKKIINDEKVTTMYFVGSKITDDIRFCLTKSFKNKKNIKDEIWKLFIIHELTHKIINNQYNNFDQITGEELSLCSTIYYNTYLGLSVLYSYLNYNSINPHRIAAMNIVRFIAKSTNNQELINNPSLIKNLPEEDLRNYAKKNFTSLISKMK